MSTFTQHRFTRLTRILIEVLGRVGLQAAFLFVSLDVRLAITGSKIGPNVVCCRGFRLFSTDSGSRSERTLSVRFWDRVKDPESNAVEPTVYTVMTMNRARCCEIRAYKPHDQGRAVPAGEYGRARDRFQSENARRR